MAETVSRAKPASSRSRRKRTDPPRGKMLEMYRSMLRIRAFESKVLEVYRAGQMPGLAHLYIGEEGTAVGICGALNSDDYIFSTHRGHGHCVAKGADMRGMMAEIMGRRDGYNKGKGGSMHITNLDFGMGGANGIVGGYIPAAAGAAWVCRLRGQGQVVVCFFGDGAANIGTFHEGINMASVWRLPVIYVCEDNQYAISVDKTLARNIEDVGMRASSYGIPGETIDGNDVLVVYDAALRAVERARKGEGPTLIDCKTYRFEGHHVADEQFKYRTREEINEWRTKRDPIQRLQAVLSDKGYLSEAEDKQLHDEIHAEAEDAGEYGHNSPWPEPEDALDHVYADDDANVVGA